MHVGRIDALMGREEWEVKGKTGMSEGAPSLISWRCLRTKGTAMIELCALPTKNLGHYASYGVEAEEDK